MALLSNAPARPINLQTKYCSLPRTKVVKESKSKFQLERITDSKQSNISNISNMSNVALKDEHLFQARDHKNILQKYSPFFVTDLLSSELNLISPR